MSVFGRPDVIKQVFVPRTSLRFPQNGNTKALRHSLLGRRGGSPYGGNANLNSSVAQALVSPPHAVWTSASQQPGPEVRLISLGLLMTSTQDKVSLGDRDEDSATLPIGGKPCMGQAC